MHKAIEERIESLLSQMTLEEKIGMIHGAGIFRSAGVPRLGIPDLIMSDGPMGVREQFQDKSWIPDGHSADRVSYLPCNSAVASTWKLQKRRHFCRFRVPVQSILKGYRRTEQRTFPSI